MRRFLRSSLVSTVALLAAAEGCSSSTQTNPLDGGKDSGSLTNDSSVAPDARDAAAHPVDARTDSRAQDAGSSPAPDATSPADSGADVGIVVTHDGATADVHASGTPDASSRDAGQDSFTGSSPVPVTLSSSVTEPSAIVSDGTSLFFIDTYGDGNVWTVPASGGATAVFATGSGSDSAIATNASSIYWTAHGNDAGTVERQSPTGGVATTITGGSVDSVGVAATATHVCWTDVSARTVTCESLANSSKTVVATGQTSARAVAVDDSAVYWVAGQTQFSPEDCGVMKAAFAGGAVTTLVAVSAGRCAIAVDATTLYWSNLADGTLRKQPSGGGGAVTTLATGVDVTELVVDGSNVYWTDVLDASVAKIPIAGGAVTTLAASQSGALGIAVDATSVYWTTNNYPTGAVMKLTPK